MPGEKRENLRNAGQKRAIAVAGDIRENVLPVLEMKLNRLKKEAVKKREKLLGR